MVERGLRGGMCQVSSKQAIANNKYMGDDYDETKPSNYITYLDANNLYGLAMSPKTTHWKTTMDEEDPQCNGMERERQLRLHT